MTEKHYIGWSRDHKGKVRNRPRKDIANAVTQFNSGDSYTDQDGLGNTSPYVIYEYDQGISHSRGKNRTR